MDEIIDAVKKGKIMEVTYRKDNGETYIVKQKVNRNEKRF